MDLLPCSGEGFAGEAVFVSIEAVDVAVIGVAVIKAGLGGGVGGEMVAVVGVGGAGAGGNVGVIASEECDDHDDK